MIAKITGTQQRGVSYDGIGFTFILSPFANCQTFSIKGASILSKPGYTKDVIKKLLSKVYSTTMRRQIVIDLREERLKLVKSALKPFYKKFMIKRYISTNGSKMVLCIVQLNVNKLK